MPDTAESEEKPLQPGFTTQESKIEEIFKLILESLSEGSALPEMIISKDLNFLKGSPEEVGCVQIGVEDGYINYIYRIGDINGETVVVKWARLITRLVEAQNIEIPENMQKEAENMLLRNGRECKVLMNIANLVPGYTPGIYWLDEKRHFFLMEDLKGYKSLCEKLKDGEVEMEDFGTMAKFLANLHSKTITKKLGVTEVEELNSISMPQSIKEMLKNVMFDTCFDEDNPFTKGRNFCQTLLDSGALKEILGNKEVKKVVECLGERFMNIQICYLHNDAHPGAIMIDNNHTVKFIDWEAGMFGNPAKEIGYALGEVIMFYYIYKDQGKPELAEKLEQAVRHYLETYLKNCNPDELITDEQMFWGMVSAHAGHWVGFRTVGIVNLQCLADVPNAEVECVSLAARLMRGLDEVSSREEFLQLAFKP